MNSIAKRLMAVFAVLMMIAAPVIIIVSDGQDSSATEIDCSKYYYNQLDTDLARHIYEKLATVTAFDEEFTVTLTDADKAAKASNPETYNRDEVSKAALAIGLDDPSKDYFYRQWAYSSGDIATVRLVPFDDFSGASKTTIDTEISTLITATESEIETPSQEYQKVRNIHDYVAEKLTYNTAHMNDTEEKNKGVIRSLYATLKDTYIPNADLGVSYCVVCEGYAKLFKALCDHYDIDCVIVTGQAGTDDKGPHMWNYVRIDENWYLVDCTWDDQGTGDIRDTYFLAGYDKIGFNSCKVIDSHDPCGTNADEADFKFTDVFSFPPLSAVSINPDTGEVDGTQYKVTFMNGSEVYEEVYVKEGEAVKAPENPTRTTPPGWQFLKWTREGGEDYDMSSPVLSNLTLYAEGTTLPIWTLSYETDGGTPIADQNVLQDVGVVKITVAVPVKEGYEFKGWNSSPKGDGLSFAPGEEIDMNSNYKLYAVWKDTGTIAYKIDSIVDQAAVFLSKETIPGVNNLLLSIGVVTAVISLLAILAISRK